MPFADTLIELIA